MKRTAKKLIAAATIAAVSIQSVPIASACGGRSGGSSYSPFYGGYARPATNYRPTSPIYHSAPTYNPVYGQTIQNGAVPQSAPTTVTAIQPRPRAQVAVQASASMQTQPLLQTQTAQGVARPQSGPQAAAVSAAVSANPVASNSNAVANANAVAADAESSALAALASLIGSQDSSSANIQPAAQPAIPSVPQSAVQPTGPQPASALTPAHVGSFRATLPSNVTIELNLNGGNTFSWVVNNNGQTSQFAGQYRITEGRLTLVRSNDLQQMAGKMTAGADGFTFQLDGANNGGLEFKKV